MKIAVIGSKGLPPKQGGIEHHCAEIYARMVEQGHTVELYGRSSYTQASWREPCTYKGVNVRSIPSLPLRGLDALVTSAVAAIAASLAKNDVIHFHALGPSLFSWIPRILSPHSKVVMTCHGLDWQRTKWGKISSTLIRLGEQIGTACSHEVVAVSKDLKPYFQQVYNRSVTYIGNGPAHYPDSDVNIEGVESLGLQPQKYVLFLGRLVPEKCPHLLIQAFQSLRPLGWKLAIVGGTSDTSTYTSKLMRLAEHNPDIIFTGELRGQRLANVVRCAGLFTLSSELEGLPLALLEAMHEGVPVLTSDIPVHRELVGGDRGQLFRVNDLSDFITQMQWSMDHLPEMKHRATQAQQYVIENYSWDTITTMLLNRYHSKDLVRPSAPITMTAPR